MKISRDIFENLISEYLDGECSPAEAQVLSDCIKADKSARDFFLRSCAAHKTLCRLYGKEAKLAKLACLDVEELLQVKKPSKFKTAAEWAAVACLFVMAAALMVVALDVPQASADDSESLSANADYDARITDGIRADDSEITIVTIVPKRCVLLLP